MASGVYKIVNKINGHCYIGSAANVKRRWNNHINLLNNNKHANCHLQRAYNKYGADAFEFLVIEYCFPFSLLWREQFFLDTIKPEYNISICAASPNRGLKASDETRKKISLGGKGRVFTPEHRARMSNSMKLQITPERRAQVSALHKGKITSLETRAKISASKMGSIPWNKGKTLSPEARARMSASAKGKTVTPETRAKISAANLGKHRAPFSPEHCAKISAAKLGKTSWSKGKTFSPEARAKMSVSQKANKTPERLAQMSATTKASMTPERRAKMSAAAILRLIARKAKQESIE